MTKMMRRISTTAPITPPTMAGVFTCGNGVYIATVYTVIHRMSRLLYIYIAIYSFIKDKFNFITVYI